MRKFILYSLLMLLLLATAMLAFGFYNAKKIRDFAKNASSTEKRYGFDGELQNVEDYFQKASNQNSQAVQENTANFEIQMDSLMNKVSEAQQATIKLSAPRMARKAKSDLKTYYTKIYEQAATFRAVVTFINQISDISSIFERMNDKSTIDDIRNITTEAKDKSDAISFEKLPPALQDSAAKLTASYKDYLSAINEAAQQKSDNTQQLESIYADFSKNSDQFFANARQFILGMENLDTLKSSIDSELINLSEVYFSIR